MFRELVPFMVKSECGFQDETIFRTLISIEAIAAPHLPVGLVNSVIAAWMEDALFIRNHLMPLTSMLMAEPLELPLGLSVADKMFDFIRMQDIYFLREMFRCPGASNMRRSLSFVRYENYELAQESSLCKCLVQLYSQP